MTPVIHGAQVHYPAYVSGHLRIAHHLWRQDLRVDEVGEQAERLASAGARFFIVSEHLRASAKVVVVRVISAVDVLI